MRKNFFTLRVAEHWNNSVIPQYDHYLGFLSRYKETTLWGLFLYPFVEQKMRTLASVEVEGTRVFQKPHGQKQEHPERLQGLSASPTPAAPGAPYKEETVRGHKPALSTEERQQ